MPFNRGFNESPTFEDGVPSKKTEVIIFELQITLMCISTFPGGAALHKSILCGIIERCAGMPQCRTLDPSLYLDNFQQAVVHPSSLSSVGASQDTTLASHASCPWWTENLTTRLVFRCACIRVHLSVCSSTSTCLMFYGAVIGVCFYIYLLNNGLTEHHIELD